VEVDGPWIQSSRAKRWDTGLTGGGPGTLWLLDLFRGGRTRFTFTQNGSDNYGLVSRRRLDRVFVQMW
jgi:hypothetical protein